MAKFELKAGNFHIKIGGDKSINKNAPAGIASISYVNSFFADDIVSMLSYSSDTNIVKAITECPQVATILYRRAQSFANGKLEVLKTSNDNYVTGENKRFQKLVDKPNVLQNGRQFRGQVEFYTLAFGYCPILLMRPEGMNEVSSMWIIPPQICKIEFKKILPFYVNDFGELIEKISIRYKGKDYILNKDDIGFFKDTTENRKDCPLPASRLTSLSYPISTSIQNYKSRSRLISKPYGILSNQTKDNISTLPFSPEDKEELQKEWAKYGTNDGQYDMVLTNAALQFTSMMPPIRDLQLLELLKSDSAVMCDVIGYEYDLLSRDIGGVALNNKNESNKLLYQNYVIPSALNFDEQLGEMLNAEDNKIKFVTDYSHLPVFQMDEKLKAEMNKLTSENATYLFQNNAITHERYMQLIEEEVVSEYASLYYFEMPFNQQKNTTNETATN